MEVFGNGWALEGTATDARRKYFTLRTCVVIASALIPALVGLRELDVWRNRAWIFALASIIASLIVAICAGIEGLFSFGDIWREKRAAAELIKSEGFSFLQLTGDYKQFTTHAGAFEQFAANVEGLIRSEIKEYIVAVNAKNRKRHGEAIIKLVFLSEIRLGGGRPRCGNSACHRSAELFVFSHFIKVFIQSRLK
ncbi:MAG TPA: DUF4231 domain-containing protein [Terriglobales bacterium]|nr:DUF4231 domain-containing protein [Terriglobales bacterium]